MPAGEFRSVVLLSRAEVRARELGRWVRDVWRSPAAENLLVASVAMRCVAVVLYVAYILIFGG